MFFSTLGGLVIGSEASVEFSAFFFILIPSLISWLFVKVISHFQEDEKRKQALKDAELDRKKKHIDDEYQREKKRQEIRDKYGIQKKPESTKDKQKVLNEMKKEYGMSEEDASELQKKMFEVTN